MINLTFINEIKNKLINRLLLINGKFMKIQKKFNN